MFWIIYLLLVSGYSFSHGFYSLGEILILLISFFFFFKYFLKEEKDKNDNLPLIIFFISSLYFLLLYGGLYQENEIIKNISFFLCATNLFLVGLSLFKNELTSESFRAIFSLHIILRILMIISSPSPYIDIFDFLKYGALGLLKGENPYALSYHQFYEGIKPDTYFYLPATIFITLPFVFIFGDPRVAIFFTEILTAYLITKLRQDSLGKIIALIFLANPMSLFILEQSYIEPIILFEIILWIFFLFKKNYNLSAITMGVFLATKQYLVVFPLFLFRISSCLKIKPKYWLTSFSVFSFFILPFFLWSPKDFIHDTLSFEFLWPPRYEGLTFFSLLYHLLGIKYNWLLGYFFVFLVFLFIYLVEIRTLSRLILAFTLFLFAFFLFNKWAFVNYYYLISQLFLFSSVFPRKKE